jgi:hypothetical protein
VVKETKMRSPSDTLPEIDVDNENDIENELENEPGRDSQFESFFDAESGVWTLRRIPSSPPTCGAEDDAA